MSNLFTQPNNLQEQQQDHQDLKKRKEDHAIEIRNNKRQEVLKKHRQPQQQQTQQEQYKQNAPQLMQNLAINSVDPQLRESLDSIYQMQFKNDQFQQLVIFLNSQDILQQHQGCIGLRKLLSVEDQPPIQMAIDSNCVPRFIEFIKQYQYPILILEAAWCLTNIASGTTHQTQSIIDKGAIPLFCRLLQSPFTDISEQAIWALGNISGDCNTYRDMILKCDGLNPLVNILMNTTDKKTIKHGSWALSNLCRGKPLPQYELVQNAIEPICKVLQTENDTEVLTDCAWAISYLSDGEEERIQRVINTGVIPTLVRLIGHQMLSILIPCLRTLGNICTGTDDQTDIVLNHGALHQLFALINHEKKAVRREACWVLSNIAAGNSEQISQIVRNNAYVELLFTKIQNEPIEISREASWVISNCTSQGFPEDIKKLVELGILKVFTNVLKTSQDAKQLAVVLESLNHILSAGEKNFMVGNDNPFALQLEAHGALDYIEKLQEHPEDDVYQKSIRILENYYELENQIDQEF